MTNESPGQTISANIRPQSRARLPPFHMKMIPPIATAAMNNGNEYLFPLATGISQSNTGFANESLMNRKNPTSKAFSQCTRRVNRKERAEHKGIFQLVTDGTRIHVAR